MKYISMQMLALGLAVLLCGGALTSAQQRQNRQAQRENVRCKGKVKAIGPGVLQVVGDEGEQWLVGIEAQPKDISFQGTASVGFLRPGMLVQFTANLDKKGEAHTPVSEVKVVAPRPDVELGLQATGGLGGKQLFSDEEESSKKKRRGDEQMSFAIGGTIRSLRDRKFYVATGMAVVRGEFADDCSVTVDLADYSLTRPGDSVELDGWHYPGQPNRVFATRLTISAEEPLLSAEEIKRKRAAEREAEKKGGETSPIQPADASKDKPAPEKEKAE